jgi:4-phytase/acid phosphatase
MIKPLGAWCALSAIACAVSAPAAAAPAPELKVERVVMLMRHGIRPPTKAQPIPKQYSPLDWPQWTVAPGMLTERGAKGIALLAKSDRAWLIEAGLIPATGCPDAGAVSVRASNKPRAVETAETWVGSALPGCALTVDHPGEAASDPLFHALEEAPADFDGHRASVESLATAPAGGLAAEDRRLAPLFDRLEAILGCNDPACDLRAVPSRLIAQPHDRPDVDGAIDVASTASQSLLLEYLEGMPMDDVGWGRASRADIEQLLDFHPVKFKYGNRPAYIAKASAGPIARAIVQSFSAAGGPRIALLAGHDTNLADLGGLLDLHWHAASYPADDIPPGGTLVFQLLGDGHGGQYVRAFFRAQTMDQLRALQPLDSANPPYRAYIDIPGCGTALEPTGCTLGAFNRLVASKLD